VHSPYECEIMNHQNWRIALDLVHLNATYICHFAAVFLELGDEDFAVGELLDVGLVVFVTSL